MSNSKTDTLSGMYPIFVVTVYRALLPTKKSAKVMLLLPNARIYSSLTMISCLLHFKNDNSIFNVLNIVVWTLELLELLLLFLDFSFDLCLINFHHCATPNFLNILNLSINQAVFLSVNLSINLFHSLNINI